MSEEHVLTGGNVAAQVVRVDATVRKPATPATPATPAVEALLRHLEAAGFAGAPRALGALAAGGDPAADGPRLRALADGWDRPRTTSTGITTRGPVPCWTKRAEPGCRPHGAVPAAPPGRCTRPRPPAPRR